MIDSVFAGNETDTKEFADVDDDKSDVFVPNNEVARGSFGLSVHAVIGVAVARCRKQSCISNGDSTITQYCRKLVVH